MLRSLRTLLLLVFAGQLVLATPVQATAGCGAPAMPAERVDVNHHGHHEAHAGQPQQAAATAHQGASHSAHHHDPASAHGAPVDRTAAATATANHDCDCGCVAGLHCAPASAAMADRASLTFVFSATLAAAQPAMQPTLTAHDRRLERPPA